MRNFLAFACCTLSGILNAQQVGITGQFGYAIGETDNAKQIMLVNGVTLTTSFNLNGLYSLVAGAGMGTVKWDSNAGVPSVFNERVFLLLPVVIRRSFPLGARSATTLEVGCIGSFLIRDKFELRNVPDPGTFFRKAQGRSLAIAGAATYRYLITPTSAIALGFASSEDVFLHYPNGDQKLLLRKWLFAFTFSRALRQKPVHKTFKPL
jgi:hypothetical protein